MALAETRSAPPAADAPHSIPHEFNKLQKRLRRQVGQAIADFGMIEEGDRIMVCLSGGKDSYTMLDILRQLQAKAPVRFELVAVNLDQKQPGFPEHVLPEYLAGIGQPFHILEQDTYSVVKRVVPEGKTMCSLCSRLRRGALYTYAEQNGFTKIALGHHRDDLLATFFLNLFFHAKLSGMPPKLQSDDGKHTVIRPLAYVKEADIAAYAEAKAFPIIPCTLCGSQENLQRKVVKRMLDQWEKEFPGRLETISRALGDVRPSQLSDRSLFDFMALGRRGDAPLPDLHAWMAGTPAAVAGDATDDADDDAAAPRPEPDALAAIRAKTFDPIWNP
ncbi:tRNA 2-thiocytidine(32) synthetase TtcA [Silanimonas algicola]